MTNDLLYQVALTLVPNIGNIQARNLIQRFGNARSIFAARKKELEQVEGMGPVRASSIKAFSDFESSEAELLFIEKYKITPLFINDAAYPKRLLNCYDAPVILYYRGNCDLNTDKIIAVIGTRKNTEYGKSVCEKIIDDLREENILIISGLAFGIDTIAHKSALRNNLQTVGVLAHGLDRIYPFQNKQLARQMTMNGGLLTEFLSNTNPDKQNFPKRNRIVAGICDAVLVIETGKSGGSLITAELGNNYNKDVFAIPGRTIDQKSEGCNYLIKSNKAALINNANDLLEMMNWKPVSKPSSTQRSLFIELNEEEKIIMHILQQKTITHIDELFYRSELSSSAVAAAVLSLEMQGIISSHPGKLYKLN